jgi:hypothetical protein
MTQEEVWMWDLCMEERKMTRRQAETAATILPSLVSHSTCFDSMLNYPLMFTLSTLRAKCWYVVLAASEGPS